MNEIILEGKVVPVKLRTDRKNRKLFGGTGSLYYNYVVDTLRNRQFGRCEVIGCHRLEKDSFEIDHILEKDERNSCKDWNRDWIDNLQLLCTLHHKWKTQCGHFTRASSLLERVMYPHDAKAQSLLIVRLRVGEVIWDEVSHVLIDGAMGLYNISLKTKINSIKREIKKTKENNKKMEEEMKSINNKELAATLYQFRYRHPPYDKLKKYEAMTEKEYQKEREESNLYGLRTLTSERRDKLIERVPKAVNFLQKELNKVKSLSLMHWKEAHHG